MKDEQTLGICGLLIARISQSYSVSPKFCISKAEQSNHFAIITTIESHKIFTMLSAKIFSLLTIQLFSSLLSEICAKLFSVPNLHRLRRSATVVDRNDISWCDHSLRYNFCLNGGKCIVAMASENDQNRGEAPICR